MTTANLAEKQTALDNLLASQQTLLLSTATVEGIPEQSYAPYVHGESGHFYVLISELAAHTTNLMANPQASIMVIRPESDSNNPFARERAIYHCTAKEVFRDEWEYIIQLQALQERFGSIVELLSSLSDFHLFALFPTRGRYVAGFGLAYTVNTDTGTLSPLIKKHGQ